MAKANGGENIGGVEKQSGDLSANENKRK